MSGGAPLDLGGPEYARLAADILELCTEYRKNLRDRPVWTEPDAALLDRVATAGIPEDAAAWDAIRETVRATIFASQGHLAHPRFFAFVPSPNNLVSGLADLLVSVHNPFAGNWLEGSGAQTVERVLTDWLRREIGLPASCGGIFLSGGSLSNLTALVAARHCRFGEEDWRRGTLYVSDQAHSSVIRAARILGFAHDQVRVIPADEKFRLPVALLQAAMHADQDAGRVPFCVVGTAGTTNTGAVDPLRAISRICRDNQAWLHVDGAHGGAAVLCPEGKEALDGLDLADSLTLDPHKWLFQPFASSCLLVRDQTHLRRAFHLSAEYLEAAEGGWNLFDYGPELSRPFRAFKLWLSLQVFGASAFRQAIAHGFHLARYAEQCVRRLPDWEVVTPASMAILTFRYAPAGTSSDRLDQLNRIVADHCCARGNAFVITTRIQAKTVLRLCTINPRTTEADIASTIEELAQIAREAGAA